MQLERDDWTRISQVHMKHVACGDGGMWGVRDDARAVYYREATRKTRGLSRGSRDWVQVELPAGVSGAKMLDVGQNVVWMLDNTGQVTYPRFLQVTYLKNGRTCSASGKSFFAHGRTYLNKIVNMYMCVRVCLCGTTHSGAFVHNSSMSGPG